MLTLIYSQPFWLVIAEMFLAVILWPEGCRRLGRGRKWVNVLLCVVGLAVTVYITILSRQPMPRDVILAPFATFEMARRHPELYRTMLMNVLLFLPFGLTSAQLFPAKWPAWIKCLLVTPCGALLSVLVEYLQYRWMLGRAEVDDVLCNGFGALLGGISLCISPVIRRWNRWRDIFP